MSHGQLGDRINGRRNGTRLHRADTQANRMDEMLGEKKHTLQEFIDEMERLDAQNPRQRVLSHLKHLTNSESEGSWIPHRLRIERVAPGGMVHEVREDNVREIGNDDVLRAPQ